MVYKGVTKKGRVKLGEVYQSSPQGHKWKIRHGKVRKENGHDLSVNADSFILDLGF